MHVLYVKRKGSTLSLLVNANPEAPVTKLISDLHSQINRCNIQPLSFVRRSSIVIFQKKITTELNLWRELLDNMVLGGFEFTYGHECGIGESIPVIKTNRELFRSWKTGIYWEIEKELGFVGPNLKKSSTTNADKENNGERFTTLSALWAK